MKETFSYVQGCGLGLDVSVSRRTNKKWKITSRLVIAIKNNLYFNVSITPRELQTSRPGLVSISSFYVSCPSLVMLQDEVVWHLQHNEVL